MLLCVYSPVFAIRICICARTCLFTRLHSGLKAAERTDERRRRNAAAARWWSCCCRGGMRLRLPCFLVINPLAILSKQSQFVFWPDVDIYSSKSKLVSRCFRTGDKGQNGLSEDLTWVHVSNRQWGGRTLKWKLILCEMGLEADPPDLSKSKTYRTQKKVTVCNMCRRTTPCLATISGC